MSSPPVLAFFSITKVMLTRESNKSSLITTMLERAWRISSSWQHFTDEWKRLEIMFCKLKDPQHMVKTTIRLFTSSRITVQQHLQSTNDKNLVRVVLPFKDQRSADIVRNRLKDLSCKTSVTIQPVFVSQKINDLLKIREKKPSIVNQQRVVYKFSWDLCDTGYYIGYTMRHLHERVEEHKHKQSSICKHYMSKHGTIPRDLTENITVLRKCKGKFECLLYEMLFLQKEKPPLCNLDLINIISSMYLDSRSNESSRRNLAEKPANFTGCRLLNTTLLLHLPWPLITKVIETPDLLAKNNNF